MDASLTDLLPRLFGSMAVVVVVMYLVARVTKNKKFPGAGSFSSKGKTERSALEVLSRAGVGKGAAVTIIRTGDKVLVLGVTDSRVSLLTELDEATEAAPALELVKEEATIQRTGVAANSGQLPSMDQAWKGLLEQVRERTVRKA